MTQGMAIPAIKHFKSGFGDLHAFCGEREVTPIHPFRLEHRVSDTDTIEEGLFVFDPGALGPQCGGVKFVLTSSKQPESRAAAMVYARSGCPARRRVFFPGHRFDPALAGISATQRRRPVMRESWAILDPRHPPRQSGPPCGPGRRSGASRLQTRRNP